MLPAWDASARANVSYGAQTNPVGFPETIQKVRETFALATEQSGFAAYELSPGTAATGTDLASIAAWVSQNYQLTYHPGGGCTLGKVVDSRFRVYDVTGLRVIDTSVLPIEVPNHAALTLSILLGEQAAKLILQDVSSH